MLALNKRIQKLEYAFHHLTKQHIEYDLDKCSFTIPTEAEAIQYSPYSTTLKFHKSTHDIKLLIGPYNSGKSSACCAEIILQAINMPPNNNGIRQSKWAIIRSTAGELETTSHRTWMNWTSELGVKIRHVDPYLRYNYQFNDGKGLIELEVLFLALAGQDDIRKLKSLDLTGAWINEASEIHKAVFDQVPWRLGRFPDPVRYKYKSGLIMDTNPPDQDHWIYNLFEVQKPESYLILHQPAALLEKNDKYVINPKAENLDHIEGHGNYYLKNSVGKSKEFIKVYCMGEYGITFDGKLVFSEFNPDIHCMEEIEPDIDYPLLIGWDFGLTPACLICQVVDGRLYAIKEFVTDRSGIRQLAEDVVIPYLNRYFADFEIEESIGDPASLKKGSEVDLINPADILSDVGIDTIAAPTNEISSRITAIKWFLNRLIEGKGAFVLSEKGCPILKKAFLQKYYFKRMRQVGTNEVAEQPIKLHPFSDIIDCLEYISLYYIGSFEKIEENEKENGIDLLSETESAWC